LLKQPLALCETYGRGFLFWQLLRQISVNPVFFTAREILVVSINFRMAYKVPLFQCHLKGGKPIMRLTLLILALFVLVGFVLATAGIMYFQSTEDKASITIDKQKLKEKTQEAIEKTKEAGSEGLERMGKALHKTADELKNSSNERNVPPATPKHSDKPPAEKNAGESPRNYGEKATSI
jgi:hypothetical protein